MNKKHYLWGYGIGLFAALCIVLIWGWAQGAPLSQIFRSLIPESDNEFYVGTTSPSNVRWRAIFLGTGTSTAANGFDLSAGCFAVGGVCLPTSGVTGSGVTNRIAYFSGASSLTSDADFVVDGALGRLTYTYGSTTALTATYASSTALTADNLFSTNASSTYLSTSQNLIAGNTLIVPGLTSALTLTGAAGIFAEYTGTSCTNQFPRSLSALGVATCASVALGADVTGTLTVGNGGTGATSYTSGSVIFSNGTILTEDNTNLIFNDTLNRLTTPYASTTALGITGNLYGTYGSTTVFDATRLFNTNASTTYLSFDSTGNLIIPARAAVTLNYAGQIAIDTTDDQVKYFGGSTRVLTYKEDFGFSVASSSTFMSNDIDLEKLLLKRANDNWTITGFDCITDVGTQVIALYETTTTGGITDLATNGVDGATTVTCDSDGASDDGSLSNATIDVNDWIALHWGASATSPQKINITVRYTVDAE